MAKNHFGKFAQIVEFSTPYVSLPRWSSGLKLQTIFFEDGHGFKSCHRQYPFFLSKCHIFVIYNDISPFLRYLSQLDAVKNY